MSAPCGSSEQADGLKRDFEEEGIAVILNPQPHRGMRRSAWSSRIYTGFCANGTPGAVLRAAADRGAPG